jgi:hypothetical protein
MSTFNSRSATSGETTEVKSQSAAKGWYVVAAVVVSLALWCVIGFGIAALLF